MQAINLKELLTKKELEILRYIINGLCTKQIAGELCLSEKTVSKHRANILHKTGMPTIIALLGLHIQNLVE